jgi:hypothetical protein
MSFSVEVSTRGLEFEEVAEKLSGPVKQKLIERLADVAWANSLVKYFEEKAAAGTALAFASTLAVRNVSSTNVKITNVGFSAVDVAAQNLRSFSLELQEVL